MSAHETATELAQLSVQLKQRPKSPADERVTRAGDVEPARSTCDQLEIIVQEIRDVLAKQGEELDEVVASHPWAAVASAFLFGVVVGRLLPRG